MNEITYQAEAGQFHLRLLTRKRLAHPQNRHELDTQQVCRIPRKFSWFFNADANQVNACLGTWLTNCCCSADISREFDFMLLSF